jgi:pimeloyl-ACP methyl ester carboxylesterase
MRTHQQLFGLATMAVATLAFALSACGDGEANGGTTDIGAEVTADTQGETGGDPETDGGDPETDAGADVPADVEPERDGEDEPERGCPDDLPWEPCPGNPGLFQCTTLSVPLDWQDDRADARMLELALLRRPVAARANCQGVVFAHFGGGGSNIRTALDALPTFERFHLFPNYDLVTWDSRGEGWSTPVSCGETGSLFDLEMTPASDEEWAAVEAASLAFAAACQESARDVMPFLDTESTAHDMDAIRGALGHEQVNLIGVSYGTFVGAMYATLFPERVRAFVLDAGAIRHADYLTLLRSSASANETELRRLLADCGANAGCEFHGGEGEAAVLAAFDALAARIDDATLPVQDREPLEEAGFWQAVLSFQHGRRNDLPAALAAAEAGDGGPLAAILPGPAGEPPRWHFAGEVSNWGRAIMDSPCPPGYDLVAHRAFYDELRGAGGVSPHMGFLQGLQASRCIGWSIERAHPPVAIDARDAPPLLVIGGRHDPTLPFALSETLVTKLNNGSCLAAWEGEGHSALANQDLWALTWAIAFIDDPSTFPTDCE